VTTTPALRVLSYNVRHGQGVASLFSNARLARVISAISPTVAGLQEVWRVGSLYDQPARLGELTRMDAVYHSTFPAFGGQTGNLLLSSGIVHAAEEIGLGGRRETRGCLVADVETGDGIRFSFAVTHLALDRATRATQLELLARRLPSDRPLVLVGDFNCGYGELEPLLGMLTFSAETPLTYPSVYPLRALDHIGYSAHWELERLEALPSWASDHRPLVGELRFVG
jgi:endonuclease/exonuclease/phosphatase family metal-dependent hydrolase